MILRPYQLAALDQIRAKFAAGRRRVLLVAPVGSGKTTKFAEAIRRSTANVLVLVHRKELLDQASARLDLFGIRHGVIMSGHPRVVPSARVQVASIQTLRNRPKPPATLIIVDEAHRAKAATWLETLAFYPDAYVLGLTATPWRLDGKGLGDLFEELVLAATPRQLVDEGYLTEVTGFMYDQPDLKGITKSHGDFNEKQSAAVMSKPKIIGNIVEQWKARSSDLSTVAFAVTIEHSRALVAEFVAVGVRAEHLDGTTPKLEREAILARVASGETQVVSNVNVLTEGTDIPRLKCCILARPTMSLSLYIQMVGRVSRPWEDLAGRIHDHAGCVIMHGLPYADREYSLAVTPKRRAKLDGLRTCKQCRAIYDPKISLACPACGYVNEAGARGGPEFIPDGVIVEFDSLEFKPAGEYDSPELKAEFFRLREYFGPVKAAAIYKKKHGMSPFWGWTNQSV